MSYILKFALQTLAWLVAITLANNLGHAVVRKIKFVKIWNLKKA